MREKKKISILKIFIIIIIVFLSMCAVSVLADKIMPNSSKTTGFNEKEQLLSELDEILQKQEEEKKEGLILEEITYSNYKELLDNKSSFILYIGRSTCPDCEKFEPVLQSIEFDAIIKHINTQSYKDAITNEEENAQQNYDAFKEDVGFEWIPYVCAVKDGEVISEFDFKFPEKFSELTEEETASYIEDMHSRFVSWLVEYQNMIYPTTVEIVDEDACEIDTRCD